VESPSRGSALHAPPGLELLRGSCDVAVLLIAAVVAAFAGAELVAAAAGHPSDLWERVPLPGGTASQLAVVFAFSVLFVLTIVLETRGGRRRVAVSSPAGRIVIAEEALGAALTTAVGADADVLVVEPLVSESDGRLDVELEVVLRPYADAHAVQPRLEASAAEAVESAMGLPLSQARVRCRTATVRALPRYL
jgi:hypothetical protein